MYTSEFWDKVYDNQNNTPPWTAREHKESATNRINEHVHENIRGKHILDYGCGNGHIGESFLEKGADVDFAEISTKMVEIIRQKYFYSSKVGKTLDETAGIGHVKVFGVESPNDLPIDNETYDYIIAWAVFHHVDPNNWKEFLDKFGKLLKGHGKLIIAGRDETDIVLRQDEFKGHVTGQPSYTINTLPEYLDTELFEVKETGLFDEKIPAFDVPRTFRCFIIEKKQ